VSAVTCARTGYAYRGAQVTARATVHQAGLATLLNLRSGEVPSLTARHDCGPHAGVWGEPGGLSRSRASDSAIADHEARLRAPRGGVGAWWLVAIALQ